MRSRSNQQKSPGAITWRGIRAGSREIDVWHVLDQVDRVVGDADDTFVLLAAPAGKTVDTLGQGRFAGVGSWSRAAIDEALGVGLRCPFNATAASPFGIVELLAM